MELFLNVVLFIIWIVLMAAALFGTIALCMVMSPVRAFPLIGTILAGIGVLAFVISAPFAFGWISMGDNAEHCGPGTVYVSHTRWIGRNPVTEWQCVIQ